MTAAPEPSTADWEAFYRSYRKPGYVPGYEITSKLGGGMFGLVFRARKQSIGKDYAIKFLKVDDGEVRRAVLQELEQVRFFAQVDHPNLVSIEDRGEVDGIPYIVMAYAGSETLRDELGKAAADRRELVCYFLQACRGVAALHERSLVHFDLKPANVFLKGGVARVGDYGLSKLVVHSQGSLSMGRGTPYYMAPEMLQRRGDHRSDIYSLGVMLYEVLTGEVPFRGDSEWEVLRKHETETPRFPPDVAPRHRTVLQRCLAKDPADRYPSVQEVMADLGAAASAGAAAWEEARAGVEGTSRVPPPPPPDDPRAELMDAARKAQATARQIALEAIGNARVAAGQAVRDARAAVQDAAHRCRRRRAEWRERRLRKEQARRGVAPEGWPEMPRRGGDRHRIRWGLVGVAAVLLWMLWGTGSPRPEATVVAYRPARPFAPPAEDLQAGIRAQSEALARSAQADVEDLRRRIRDLQRRVEWGPLPSPAFEGVDEGLLVRVRRFGATQPYDAEEARALLAEGHPALLAMVKAMQETAVTDPVSLGRAVNLHALLEEATGFRDIELSPDADVARNARAAALWAVFLRSAAPDAETWREYLRARGR